MTREDDSIVGQVAVGLLLGIMTGFCTQVLEAPAWASFGFGAIAFLQVAFGGTHDTRPMKEEKA
jgi:hypothetical protein